MTWIKICGITNLEDALAAVEAGADALGFVFYNKSLRYVDPEKARTIVTELPKDVEKVGVFVDETWDNIQRTVARAGLTGIQISVDGLRKRDTKSGARTSAVERYLVLRASDFLDDQGRFEGFAWFIDDTKPPTEISAVFLDSGTTQQPGGTGRTFDWEKARHVAEGVKQMGLRLVVAGGLTPANVAEAIRILEPWGVDISSGVEARPGKKDPENIRAFIAAVRQLEKTA